MASGTRDVLQRLTYEAFGGVRTTKGEGARTSYIGREEDNESGLGFYGVRLYEPEYGRFTGVDAYRAEYLNFNPYEYSLNSPIGLFDNGGKWVQGMDDVARLAIVESVPIEFQSKVTFDANGVVQPGPLLEAAVGQDPNSNIAILSRLAENDLTVQVQTSDTYETKNREDGRTELSSLTEEYSAGITLIPEKDAQAANLPAGMPVSTNGTTQIYLRPDLPQQGKNGYLSRGQIAAHELFSHFRFFILAKAGKAETAAHHLRGQPKNDVDKAADNAENGADR
ncbi:MAG: hypothetical protein HYX66_06930 [Ignavibacteria bacterium]|nr:hypothetical protein [Ignavibacteria bacterium]